LGLLYQGHARVVGDEFRVFDFNSWLRQKVEIHHECIGLVDRAIRVPRVLLLTLYDRLPIRKVKFSRYHVFLRDQFTCQYCGEIYPKTHLNLDHVVPRSRGGKTHWENVVCCCLGCNHRKGGNLPQEVGMGLIREPAKPRWVSLMDMPGKRVHYREWRPFLHMMPM
jgi:5-methylcytosine-specific restriction endonuclease McrA